MKRREFITLVGGAIFAFLLPARAQSDRMRRVGLLMGYPEGDAEGLANVAAFKRGLPDIGWTDGRNVRIETRWAGSDPVKSRTFAKELIGMTPDVIVLSTNLVTGILQQETRTIPVVFVLVGNPVLSGYVASLAQPGGNMTGFSNLWQSVGRHWVEIITEIPPRVRRLGVVVHRETPATVGLLRRIEAAAPSFGIQVTALGVHTAAEIERLPVQQPTKFRLIINIKPAKA